MHWLALAVALSAGAAVARDPAWILEDTERLAWSDDGSASPEGCRIENWRYYAQAPGVIRIEGATTCTNNRLTYSLYDGAELVGSDFTDLERWRFEDVVEVARIPRTLTIRYHVDRR